MSRTSTRKKIEYFKLFFEEIIIWFAYKISIVCIINNRITYNNEGDKITIKQRKDQTIFGNVHKFWLLQHRHNSLHKFEVNIDIDDDINEWKIATDVSLWNWQWQPNNDQTRLIFGHHEHVSPVLFSITQDKEMSR